KFRLVPPGEFLMGFSDEQRKEILNELDPDGKYANEPLHASNSIRTSTPQHRVTLTRPLYVGVSEVTQKDYVAVMGVNPSAFSPKGGQSKTFKLENVDTSAFPVDAASWHDAAEFCNRLSKKH